MARFVPVSREVCHRGILPLGKGLCFLECWSPLHKSCLASLAAGDLNAEVDQ